MVKALLFDYGGTLDADGISWIDRFYAIYKEMGLDVPRQRFDRAFYDADDGLASRHKLVDLGLEETISLQTAETTRLLPSLGRPDLAEDAAQAFLRDCRAHFKRNRAILSRLRRNYRLGIVSNFYGNLEACLAAEDLLDVFDFVGDSGKIGVEKPDAAIFKAVMRGLGVAAEDCLMIGDSVPRDMRGAEGLGMAHALISSDPPASCCARGRTLASIADLDAVLEGPGLAAGVIAAGLGERLKAGFPGTVKPLVPVGGSPLCHWVARSLKAAGAASVTLLHNSRGRDVRASLTGAFPDLSWDFLEADTASSWQSFRLVALALAQRAERFLISTVDALIPPAEAARFTAEAAGAPAAMALTGFIDDESPLRAAVNARGEITALGEAAGGSGLATAGLYLLTRAEALALPGPDAYASLRQYWSDRARRTPPLKGVILAKTLDVDRPEDVAQAQEFVKL